MNRKEFLNNCAGGLCSCAAIGLLILAGEARGEEAKAVVGEVAAAPVRQTYVYKTVGDCNIHADVFRPADKMPRPVILWLHGGALIWGSRNRINAEQLARYVREGFVVVAIDYRLAPETKLPAILDDLKDAHEWIRKAGPALFQADPNRIIVVGHSAGGYLALMAGSVLTPSPRALVSFYGYGDISGKWCNQADAYYSQQPTVSKEAARQAISGGVFAEASHEARWPFYLCCVLPPAGPLGKGDCGRTGRCRTVLPHSSRDASVSANAAFARKQGHRRALRRVGTHG